MQIYSNTNNFYTNNQSYKTFKKNQTPVAFCSQQKVLDNVSKAALKEMYKEKLRNAIKNCDVKVLFEAVGIKAKKDLFGEYYTVYGYGKGGGATHNFSELGVDENKLFKKIKRVKGILDLRESNVEDLGNLKRVDGKILMYCEQWPPKGYARIVLWDNVIVKHYSAPRDKHHYFPSTDSLLKDSNLSSRADDFYLPSTDYLLRKDNSRFTYDSTFSMLTYNDSGELIKVRHFTGGI